MTPQDNSLLEKAEKLNKDIESAFIALGVLLYRIQESKAWEGNFDSFSHFYTEALGRKKSDVSMLTRIGEFFEVNGLTNQTDGITNYRHTYNILTSFPEDEPQLLLAKMKTLTPKEIKEEKIEKKFGENHQHSFGEERWARCEVCNTFVRM